MDRRVNLERNILAVLVGIADRGHGRVGKIAGLFGLLDVLAHLRFLHRRLELNLHRHAAGKVDVQQAGPASDHRDQPQHNQRTRGDRRQPLLADEVEFRLAQQLHHVELGDPAFAFGNVEDHARAEDRREHAQQDAQNQRYGEALELVLADHVQHDRHDQRRQVRIDDRPGGAAEPVAYGQAQGGTAIEFFADTFEDQHVGVDGHADGKHQAGDSRQAKGGLNGNHQRQNQHQIQDQREGGDRAGETVINEHEDEHGNHGDRHGNQAPTNEVGPLRGALFHFANRLFVQRRG